MWRIRAVVALLLAALAGPSRAQEPVDLGVLATGPSGVEWMMPIGRSVVVGLAGGLWGSDGTPEGTRRLPVDVMLQDDMVAAGDAVFFLRGDFVAPELWRTDATPAGTTLVQPLPPGLWRLHVLGAELLGIQVSDAGDAIWSLAGAPGAPRTLAALPDGVAWTFLPVGERLLVVGAGPTPIWRFERADERLVPVSDRTGGTIHHVAGDSVLYTLEDCDGATCLWRTDGTAEGNELLRTHPRPLPVQTEAAAVGDTLVYTAYGDDGRMAYWGLLPEAPTSAVLRATDHPVACTTPSFGGLYCWQPAFGGGFSLFTDTFLRRFRFVVDDVALESDGSPSGTMSPRTFPFVPSTSFFPVGDGALVGVGTDSPGGAFPASLWHTDGAPEDARELGSLPETPSDFVNAGGRVYFVTGSIITGLPFESPLRLHRVDLACADPALDGPAETACWVDQARVALACAADGSFRRGLSKKLQRVVAILQRAATVAERRRTRLTSRATRLLARIGHRVTSARGARKLGVDCAASVGDRVRQLTTGG